ncbi:IclR family transcriptional regulator [Anaerocolumna sp. MB42-C2]|uniref:IclR family transcriptional regulator n=1 Tax=Anaerocolumna sp. MB42-C2 TaxID=3070997 RepID=UPI0027E09028|nr:IclR family transcriptional regulator [Anaerocolumna sp. MB42-C2]WMJ89912.1 IclR family transcriptional regulator [Anaerocolumna sp. MB42-C2]
MIDKNNPSQFNQSAEKTMRIIEFLAENNRPMRLIDIAGNLSLNTSTTLRFINTLTELGYIEQESNSSKYYLTYKICSISNKIYSKTSLRDIVNPYLRNLARQAGESACLAIEQSRQVVYIDVADGPDQMVKGMQRIGNIAPMHCTGIGKLLLLNYTESELDDLIARKGLTKYTDNTIVTKEQLLEELKKVREAGYAFDNEECEIGARCIAFPIYDFTHKIIAGFSITGPINRISDNFIKNHIPFMKSISVEISGKLSA